MDEKVLKKDEKLKQEIEERKMKTGHFEVMDCYEDETI